MGGLSLTNPGLQYDQQPGIDPSTGMPIQTPSIIKYFKNPGARALQFAKDASQAVQPSTSTVDGTIDGQQVTGDVQPPTPSLPKMFKPSFRDVTSNPTTGLPQQINPAETKLGKLIHILGSAAQGAAAGFGTYDAAQGADRAIQTEQLPYQRIMAAQNLQKEMAQTNLLKQQSQLVQTPYGPMPSGLARVIFPAAISAGAKTGAAQIAAGAKVQSAQIAKKFMAVPQVGLFDTSTGQVVPGTQSGVTVTREIAAEYNLPKEFLGKPMSLSNLSSLESNAAKFAPEVSSETTNLMGDTKKVSQKIRPGALPNASGGTTPFLPAATGAGGPSQDMVQDVPGGPLRPAGAGGRSRPTPRVLPSANVPANANPSSSSAPLAQITLDPSVEQRLQATLPNNPQAQSYLRGLLGYRGQMPASRAKNYPQTLSLLTRIDPNFQASNYDAIRKTVMDYTPGGPVGKQALSFNTSIAHLDMLDRAADALQNGQYPMINQIANTMKVAMGKSPVTTFNNIADAVDGEVSKTFKGTATEGELARVGAHFASSLGPAQIKNNVRSTIGLLNGKMGEMQDAYQRQVGRPISMVSGDAQKAIQRMTTGGDPTHIVTDAKGVRIGTVVNGQYVADQK